MSKQIEISSRGIKFSYRRFLADTSIGLAVIFLILNNHKELYDNNIILVILIIAATPVGILVNISSWILLSYFQANGARYIVLRLLKNRVIRYFLYGTIQYLQIEDMKRFYKLTSNNYFKIIELIEHYLSIYCPDKISYYQDLIGMRIFYRNVSLVAFLTAIVTDYSTFYVPITLILIAMFFLFANIVVTIYGQFYLLMVFRLLFLKNYEKAGLDAVMNIIKSEQTCFEVDADKDK